MGNSLFTDNDLISNTIPLVLPSPLLHRLDHHPRHLRICPNHHHHYHYLQVGAAPSHSSPTESCHLPQIKSNSSVTSFSNSLCFCFKLFGRWKALYFRAWSFWKWTILNLYRWSAKSQSGFEGGKLAFHTSVIIFTYLATHDLFDYLLQLEELHWAACWLLINAVRTRIWFKFCCNLSSTCRLQPFGFFHSSFTASLFAFYSQCMMAMAISGTSSTTTSSSSPPS